MIAIALSSQQQSVARCEREFTIEYTFTVLFCYKCAKNLLFKYTFTSQIVLRNETIEKQLERFQSSQKRRSHVECYSFTCVLQMSLHGQSLALLIAHHRAAAGSLPLSSHQSQLLSLTQRPSGNAQRGLSLARVCSCRIRTAALAPLHAFLHAPIHLK